MKLSFLMRRLALVCSLLPAATLLGAQDFGFGDEEPGTPDSYSPYPLILLQGEAGAVLNGFIDDFGNADSLRLGNIFSGRLNFSAENAHALGIINLKISPGTPAAVSAMAPAATPVAIDEAYVRAYFGDFELEGGLRKLTWGKADSMGPLDVINPLDYSDLTLLVDSLSDGMAQKIARPLVRVSRNFGQFSKLEAVFVPNFEPLRLAGSGRWAPAQMTALPGRITEQIVGMTNPTQRQYAAQVLPRMLPGTIAGAYPDTSTFNYAQTGLRFTTTLGSADLGAQYYYGRLTAPAVSLAGTAASIAAAAPGLMSAGGPSDVDTALASLLPPEIAYNPYHQLGLDYAQVLSAFNVRAEAALNLTEDLAGDDGAVYNPYLAWSLGFDRDLVWGINLNLQAAETITLRHNRIGDNPLLDVEAGSDPTSTWITTKLSKRFLQDRLELSAAAIWGIEDKDCLIMPVLSWTQDDVTVGLAGGFFAGDRGGQFGQYCDNSFIQARLKYRF
ncbi:MAG: hypothetical protein LBK05_09515 [Treponema sp.]|jgi:hypothetical protein|nr:hypothetical protein [Treponema sp.]